MSSKRIKRERAARREMERLARAQANGLGPDQPPPGSPPEEPGDAGEGAYAITPNVDAIKDRRLVAAAVRNEWKVPPTEARRAVAVYAAIALDEEQPFDRRAYGASFMLQCEDRHLRTLKGKRELLLLRLKAMKLARELGDGDDEGGKLRQFPEDAAAGILADTAEIAALGDDAEEGDETG